MYDNIFVLSENSEEYLTYLLKGVIYERKKFDTHLWDQMLLWYMSEVQILNVCVLYTCIQVVP